MKIDLKNSKVIVDKDNRLWIPREIEKESLCSIHYTLGLAKAKTIYYTVRKYLLIKGLQKKANITCKECKYCQEIMKRTRNSGIFHMAKTPKTPFEMISSDIYGPIKPDNIQIEEENRKFYYLSITDHCSRWSEVFLMKNITALDVIEKLKIWIKKHGKPRTLLTDNGKQFQNQAMKKFARDYGFNHKFILPYSPESNGMSERINQTISRVLFSHKG